MTMRHFKVIVVCIYVCTVHIVVCISVCTVHIVVCISVCTVHIVVCISVCTVYIIVCISVGTVYIVVCISVCTVYIVVCISVCTVHCSKLCYLCSEQLLMLSLSLSLQVPNEKSDQICILEMWWIVLYLYMQYEKNKRKKLVWRIFQRNDVKPSIHNEPFKALSDQVWIIYL